MPEARHSPCLGNFRHTAGDFILTCLLLVLFQVQSPASENKKEQNHISLKLFPALFNAENNPAFTGYRIRPSLRLEYESNLPTFFPEHQFKAGFDQHIQNTSSNWGVVANYKRQLYSNQKHNNFNLLTTYSYSFELNRQSSLRIGLGAQMHLNPDQSEFDRIFEDQIDPYFGFVKESAEEPIDIPKSSFSLNAGILYTLKKAFVAIGANDLAVLNSSDNISGESLRNFYPLKLNLDAGYEITAGSDISITPVLSVTRAGNLPMLWRPSIYFSYNDVLLFKLGTQNTDEAHAGFGIRLFDQLALMASTGLFIEDYSFPLEQPAFWRLSLMAQF